MIAGDRNSQTMEISSGHEHNKPSSPIRTNSTDLPYRREDGTDSWMFNGGFMIWNLAKLTIRHNLEIARITIRIGIAPEHNKHTKS